jgi:ribonuclease PH
MAWTRPDGRAADSLRPVKFIRGFTARSAGSVLASFGETQVLCTVSIEAGVPKFLAGSGQGWLTAEYRMLPSATSPRCNRELMKLSGRTQEIQRLIGRSLRAAIDFDILGEQTLLIDADVLQADGGTRTTAINGSFVALQDGINQLIASGQLSRSPLRYAIGAVSVGLIEGDPMLDLNYPEDVAASVDLNVVMAGNGELVEVQGTAESGTYSRRQLNQMLDYAETGIQQILAAQQTALGAGLGLA